MNILVTGSEGFIGKHVVSALRLDGHRVRGFDKKNGVDLSDYKTVRQALEADYRPDMIIHLAGTCSTSASLETPNVDFKDNTVTAWNVATLARELGSKVIYISTCKVKPGKDFARTPYGLTKYMGENIMDEFETSFGIELVTNRLGTIYGPGQMGSTESGWIAWFIKAAIDKEPVTIYGSGRQVRDLLYIDDLLRLILDQVENFHLYQGMVWDVGGGEANAISVKNMLDKVLKYQNYNFGKARKGDVEKFVADNTISKVNGWEPLVGFREGIELTKKWYRKEKRNAGRKS